MNTENRTLLNNADVARADARVTRTGILDKFAGWKRGPFAGRPSLVSERAILVGLMLLAQDQSPLSIASLATLLQHRLCDESRQLLGLPRKNSSESAHEGKLWYGRTHTAFQRMVALMDPYPRSASASSFTGIRARLDDHDIEREITMKSRLNDFTQGFLQMTFAEQPRHLRRADQIDLAIDQTFVPSPLTAGLSRRDLDRKVAEESATLQVSRSFRPTEVFAGWCHLGGTETGELRGRGRTDFGWGWMASIALRVDSANPTEPGFPALVVAATLSMPNVGVSAEAIHLMRASLSTGLRPGIVDADKTYFASQPVKYLHLPAAELGFTPSTDYRVDRFGVRGWRHGADFIEGKAYCPDMPTALKDASIDFHNNEITPETYRKRIQARVPFELRPTGKPAATGHYRMICRVAASHHPANDSACTQKSVRFERTAGMHERQAFTYRSAKWEAFHRHARSASERFNADVRTLDTGSNGTPGQRRVRGFAAAQVLTTILLTEYNRRTTSRYLRAGYTSQGHDWIPNTTRSRPRSSSVIPATQ